MPRKSRKLINRKHHTKKRKTRGGRDSLLLPLSLRSQSLNDLHTHKQIHKPLGSIKHPQVKKSNHLVVKTTTHPVYNIKDLPYIEAIPVMMEGTDTPLPLEIDRLEHAQSNRPAHKIFFFDVPQTKMDPILDEQRGGTTPTSLCPELTNPDHDTIRGLFLYSAMYDCTVTNSGSSIKLTHSGKTLTSFGKGGFNAVFDNDDFEGCIGENYVLRLSNLPVNINTKSGKPILDEYTRETAFGIIAANHGIGPKIYKVGLMRNAANPKQVYFYSVIERITGYAVDRLIHEIKYYNDDDSENTDNINFVDGIMQRCINNLQYIAEDAGLLLLDTKPGNAMVKINKSDKKVTVYLIDFDPQFILTTDDKDDQQKYGSVNVIMFLCVASVFCNNKYDMPPDDMCGSAKSREIVLRYLNIHYYHHEDFKKIRKYIQELYLKEHKFMQACHHYMYMGILRIYYLDVLHKISFKQILDCMDNMKTGNEFVFFVYNYIAGTTPIPDLMNMLVLHKNDDNTVYIAYYINNTIHIHKVVNLNKAIDLYTFAHLRFGKDLSDPDKEQERTATYDLLMDIIHEPEYNVNKIYDQLHSVIDAQLSPGATTTTPPSSKKRRATTPPTPSKKPKP